MRLGSFSPVILNFKHQTLLGYIIIFFLPYFFSLMIYPWKGKKVGKTPIRVPRKSSHFAILRLVCQSSSVDERDSLPEGPGRRVTNRSVFTLSVLCQIMLVTVEHFSIECIETRNRRDDKRSCDKGATLMWGLICPALLRAEFDDERQIFLQIVLFIFSLQLLFSLQFLLSFEKQYVVWHHCHLVWG